MAAANFPSDHKPVCLEFQCNWCLCSFNTHTWASIHYTCTYAYLYICACL